MIRNVKTVLAVAAVAFSFGLPG